MNAEEQQQIRIEAARWLTILQSGDVDPARQAEFLQWQARTPEHARCIGRLNEKLEQLQASALRELSRPQLRQALSAPSGRRQLLRGALAIGATAVAATLFSRVGISGFAWPGDLYTGVGERNEFELEDGSRLTLNAASRVSPRFSGQQRGLVLQTGELLLEVRTGPRPFLIEINGVQIQAQQQRLLLRHEPQGCYAVALDSELQLQTPTGWQSLRTGHWARLNASREWQTGPARGGDTLWLRGLLEADAQPLHQVIDALRAYRRGIIQVAAAVADLRISGLLPLDDSDHALALLASIAPIKVQRHTDLWISVNPT